jgi:hypothetical protein
VRAIVPGDLEKSELWQRIISTDEDEIMPPTESHKAPLKREQRELIRKWIQQGAVFQAHWAYEPVERRPLPAAAAGAGEHPVDRFIGGRLAAQNLTLAREAPREILYRRLTLDLTGLPPTPEEVDAFLADRGFDAYERAVDRLLASPRYGEHFGRHWLDAVRYGDTHGLHLDNVRQIWPYRDWVVGAFNRNLRYDQFTIEQIAGDLLPNPRQDQLVASGYNRNILSTSEGGAIEAEAEARNTADRTDTTAAVFLGLTAGCAACHDHKFDPLTQKEYYSLGAFFKGLADRVWDGNVARAAPLVFLGDAQQQRRLDAIAAAFPPLRTALSARAEQVGQPPLTASSAPAESVTTEAPAAADDDADDDGDTPRMQKKAARAVTYEVVWAEDGDVPTADDFASPAARPGEWRSGPDVPKVGGERALRLEGRVERPIIFATGEVPLLVRSALKAFVHFQPDAARPPRAISLELVGEEKTKRLIWGDPAALGPDALKEGTLVGPMPPAGAFARLELDAIGAGLKTGQRYTALRLAQSDGAGWWDRVGTVNTSPNAAQDPLLNRVAWMRLLRKDARSVKSFPVTHDILYIVGLANSQQNGDEKKRLAAFHRDFIYGPTRGVLEPEVHAARRLMAEQVHYEMVLPASPISRELPAPRSAHVLIRGQYDKPGERVQPGTPAFLPPLIAAGPRATRLDLARWIVDPKNPLAARVAVNRFWLQLFGAGLVRTPVDFGVQGEPPTHPALLEWLADEFMQSGWDVKKLVRLLVTSRTYRQDSSVAPALLELDPANRLLARGPRLRLDAEVLRDQALALGGLLRPEIGGPPVRPYQPVNIWEPVAYSGSNTKTYVQDHGDSLYRRSLYTFIKRTAPHPAMTTFDGPSREAFCVGRGRSDTPLQALALMNDVQHFEAARAFAERLLASTNSEPERLRYAFRCATARMPTKEEESLLAETLATHRAHFEKNSEAASQVIANGESKPSTRLPVGEFAAWTMVASLLLNLDETVTRN